ncbi:MULTISPECIES: hypothetical protein [Acinetobacter]|uniref:hypothetical protein n=1 Tax=Acinetobacter TaxID=469 RepID=UPI00111598A3|nr:hypothetical protein [Acinetobacter genomosp. 33YU]
MTITSPSCIHVRARTTLKIPIELQRDYWGGLLLQMASTENHPPIGGMRKFPLGDELRNFRTVTQCGYGRDDHA